MLLLDQVNKLHWRIVAHVDGFATIGADDSQSDFVVIIKQVDPLVATHIVALHNYALRAIAAGRQLESCRSVIRGLFS